MLQISLPQVAVMGSQSSGKSSVIEALIDHDFLPRSPDICTQATNIHPSDLSSPLSVSSRTGAQSASGPTSTDELMIARTSKRSTSPVNKMEALKATNAAGFVAPTSIVPSAVPQARKASLVRFLEKHKERVISVAPYNFDKESPEKGTPISSGGCLEMEKSRVGNKSKSKAEKKREKKKSKR
ncbi:hypothetical protein TB1_011277 [Malus domestica]